MNDQLQQLKESHLAVLNAMQYESGLFSASAKRVTTGYDKAWLRDNFYVGLALHELKQTQPLKKLYGALTSILLKHEWKIDYAISAKPAYSFQYIHPRYNPENFDEFWESWGNRQNDAIGSILFLFGLLKKSGMDIINTEEEARLVKKLIAYLETIQYWQDIDSGIWEEWEEIHASSLAACVAGLQAVKAAGFFVADELISKGEDMLHHELLPRESHDKFCDLALLTLMYPYNVATSQEAQQILTNVEYHLTKKRGVIRYKGDHYYNKNWDRASEEAEWTFGFSFLALAFQQIGNKEKAQYYFQKAKETINEKGEIPELYYSNDSAYNENTPLAWSEAMFLIALEKCS